MLETLFKLLSLFLLSLFCMAVNAETIDAWLNKMNRAMNQQNFQGTLVIRQDDKLQAIKVKQGVSTGGSWQTLESLTGEDQIIVRQNDKVTTIFPAKKLITVSANKVGHEDGTPLHPALPENRNQLKQFYSLKLGAEARVANKVTQIIQMIPRDKHRYGYTFWLDRQSGLLLKCDLMDEKGKVLEQLMYSDIELLSAMPENQIDEAKLIAFKKVNLSNEIDVVTKKWQAKNIPVGFVLTRSVKTPTQQKPSYHMVYSDGMASVSVFIEIRKKMDKPVIGLSNMGPVNVYSSYMGDTYITAIGEVPASTVRMIAQSIQAVH